MGEQILQIDIDSMPAGREMDVLVAEKVMGWKRGGTGMFDPTWVNQDGSACYGQEGFTPSNNIAAAWEVVEKLRESWSNIVIHAANGWGITIGQIDEKGNEVWLSPSTHGDTFPLAICRAALKAIGSM